MNKISKELGNSFKEFIHSQDGYDPYEVASLCFNILVENGMTTSTSISPNKVGITLFD